MARIIGLCGSLRQGPFNAMLLRAAIDPAPAGSSGDVPTDERIEVPFIELLDLLGGFCVRDDRRCPAHRASASNVVAMGGL